VHACATLSGSLGTMRGRSFARGTCGTTRDPLGSTTSAPRACTDDATGTCLRTSRGPSTSGRSSTDHYRPDFLDTEIQDNNDGMTRLSETAAREVFHLLFLERLFKVSDPSQFVLKGGVNLRFFFGSPRYSEDMDLDVLAGSVDTLKKNGFKILQDKALRRAMSAFGIREIVPNDPLKAKQTETTQRFRVRLVTEAGIELPTKVEFSRRSPDPSHAFVTESVPSERVRPYGRLGFACPHYNGTSAALQKARALAGREAPQCRDVFDLHVLSLGGHGTRALFAAKLTATDRSASRAVIESLEYDAYAGQVVEFLEDEARERFGTAEAWDAMRLAVLELFDHG
jgi:hypothetical protein